MNHKLTILLHAIRKAGEAILKLQKKDYAITRKTNNELLTEADVLANDILKKYLRNAIPEAAWLSEENDDDEARLSSHQVWIVDPIDGTKEYVNNIPEFTISVALIEKGSPILSAVFNPTKQALFYAVKNKGAWLNQQRIKCLADSPDACFLLASRSEYDCGEWQSFASQHQIKPMGSIAYKLALVAAGRAHATFSLNPKHEWDVAAGTLLVTEAGGMVTNIKKEKIIFNRKNVKIEGIVAANYLVHTKLFTLFGENQ